MANNDNRRPSDERESESRDNRDNGNKGGSATSTEEQRKNASGQHSQGGGNA